MEGEFQKNTSFRFPSSPPTGEAAGLVIRRLAIHYDVSLTKIHQRSHYHLHIQNTEIEWFSIRTMSSSLSICNMPNCLVITKSILTCLPTSPCVAISHHSFFFYSPFFNKRLEIVTGGFVMPDEANSHYTGSI